MMSWRKSESSSVGWYVLGVRPGGGREGDRPSSRDKVRGDAEEKPIGGEVFWYSRGDVEMKKDRAVIEEGDAGTDSVK